MVVEALVPLLECDAQAVNENNHSASLSSNETKNQGNQKIHYSSKDNGLQLHGGELWTDGLICAFEFIRRSAPVVREARKKNGFQDKPLGRKPSRNSFHETPFPAEPGVGDLDDLDDHQCGKDYQSPYIPGKEGLPRSYWRPIGWTRITELVQAVHSDAGWASQLRDFTDDESDVPVADVATPYWERPVGPTWWCHLDAGHPFVTTWLGSSHWLHPAISIALKDESRLISERMKHLLYEVNKLIIFESDVC